MSPRGKAPPSPLAQSAEDDPCPRVDSVVYPMVWGPARAEHRGTVATRYPCPRWRAR